MGHKFSKRHPAEKALLKHDRKVKSLSCDVSDEQAGKDAFAETLDVFRKEDVSFANVGTGGSAPFQEFPTVMWKGYVR